MRNPPVLKRCVPCAIDVLHMHKHVKTQGHIARVKAHFTILPSDVAFTEFLATIKPKHLSYPERVLYNTYRTALT